jgi:hypothetical protein
MTKIRNLYYILESQKIIPKIVLVFLFLFGTLTQTASACECPPTELSEGELEKYEIIFRGKVISVVDCEHKFGEAIFEVQELYKGNATLNFKVLFECSGNCAKKFNSGEEWIIYSRYKQIDNALMDWCSRSRKYFRNNNEDFYKVNYGNDYDDELKFLRDKLGVHRVLETKQVVQNRNIRPDSTQMLIVLLISIAAIVLFYFLFNKLFR